MRKSSILDDIYGAAKDLHDAGLIADAEMGRYDDIRPVPEAFSPADIQRIRERAAESQQSFARRLGVSVSTVQKWEQGKKRPSGPARKLLDLVDRKGIAALS